jgi:ABC-type nitrate/sulfonate/bicarbonate transport system ATPase subunit
VPALRGPKDARAAQHVPYNWIIPKHANGVDPAKEFLLYYTENLAAATWASKLYDFPAFDKRVPQLDGWLSNDPFGAKPADKLAFLKDATKWSTNIGYPGPSNTAIGEVFGTFVIPNCSPARPGARSPPSRRSPRPRPRSSPSSRSGGPAAWSAARDREPDVTVVVELRGLVKQFEGGRVHAVDGVDLATEEGEYLALLGPPGCGKTTLLRTIAGLEEPSEGEVLIGGQVVNDLPPRARKIAMVFQSYALYPHKNVLQNIVFPLKAERLDKDQQLAKARWAAELLGIDQHLERRPRQLSGGERQRVALARALVREPHVFLLDEPLSNLDAKLRTSARDELKRFQQRVGTTTIYVTHDQAEAMGLGDRIAVMDRGGCANWAGRWRSTTTRPTPSWPPSSAPRR